MLQSEDALVQSEGTRSVGRLETDGTKNYKNEMLSLSVRHTQDKSMLAVSLQTNTNTCSAVNHTSAGQEFRGQTAGHVGVKVRDGVFGYQICPAVCV